MKQIYLIGGTMGVGKTTVSRLIRDKLDNSVFLDGDWCWDMHPFKVTDETKRMVMENICFLLNSFIKCSEYDNIIFCWVMHEQHIIDDILSRLMLDGCRLHMISLVCNGETLRKRLEKDVASGLRTQDAIGRSVVRLPLYECLKTQKADVSDLSPKQAAEFILNYC